jgi:hypothetical protein
MSVVYYPPSERVRETPFAPNIPAFCGISDPQELHHCMNFGLSPRKHIRAPLDWASLASKRHVTAHVNKLKRRRFISFSLHERLPATILQVDEGEMVG